MSSLSDWHPALLLPLLAVGLLAFARLAQRQPRFKALFPALAALALLVAVARLGGAWLEARLPWFSLLALLPLLVLTVRGVVLVFEELFRRGRGETPPALLESVVSVLLYGVGAGVVAHRVFGIELTPFLATSAVVGAVVGLALQDTLGNLFAGISLHTDGPFRVGDWVHVGETEGRVEQISWRAVRLRTWGGDGVTIPNNEVARRTVVNFAQPAPPHSRVVQLGVSYGVPPNKVFSVLAELLQQVPEVAREPGPNVRLIGYRDSAMEYEVRYWVRAYEDWRRAESEIYRLVWYHFRRHGIEIPFPIRTVHLHQAEAPATVEETPQARLERALRSIDLFRPLSEDELQTALRNFRHQHYAAGERILGEGEPGDSFCIVDRGTVEVGKALGGRTRVLAQLGEGQFFGEMALLTGEARSATVTARTDVDLFTIDKTGFEQIVVANPRVTVDISSILAARRDALSQAEGEATQRFSGGGQGEDKQQHLLQRIRGYFGL